MSDLEDAVSAAIEKSRESEDRMNAIIAAMVALLATIVAVFNVKDGNITQAMAQEQAKAIDSWTYYQAKSTKQSIAESMLQQLVLEQERDSLSPARIKSLAQHIEEEKIKISRYEQEKESIRAEAIGHEKHYDELNNRDDQFDAADAALSIAIALLGISALTRQRWLVGVASLFSIIGLASGFSGFFELSFKLEFLAKILS